MRRPGRWATRTRKLVLGVGDTSQHDDAVQPWSPIRAMVVGSTPNSVNKLIRRVSYLARSTSWSALSATTDILKVGMLNHEVYESTRTLPSATLEHTTGAEIGARPIAISSHSTQLRAPHTQACIKRSPPSCSVGELFDDRGNRRAHKALSSRPQNHTRPEAPPQSL